MIKNNFTNTEMGLILSAVGLDFNLRITKDGNPSLTHKDSKGNTQFTFYKTADKGVKIRKRLGYGNRFGSGNVLNGGNAFADIKSAVGYFKKYAEKRPATLVGRVK